MAEATELTFRDVLEQLDRRLTRVEDDLRLFRQSFEQRFAAFEARLDGRFAAFEATLDSKSSEERVTRVEERVATLDAKVDRQFRWTAGLILASWLSTMSAILLK